jgi:hypothetical protein
MEPSQDSTADGPWQRCLFLLKTATLEATNVSTRCRSLHNPPRWRLTASMSPFKRLHVEYIINSGPFGYEFKVDDIPDVQKADQHCSDLALSHPWYLWPGDSP